jgi:hypothetical protein
MSDTNGKTESVAALKEQVEAARLRVELRHLEATESVYNQTQEFVNPAEPLFDSPDFIFPWYGENIPFNLDNRLRGELLPVYITEYGLKILRDYSRWMMAYNPWAIQIKENKVSYICGKGFGYTCAPAQRSSDSIHGDNQLCKIAQRYLDRFMERTNWGAWEQQFIGKDTTDGEAFLRFFHLGGGEVTVRPIEPEHVRSPGDQQAHQSFGVETPQNDILKVNGFWVVEDPSYKWYPSFVPAEQILHVKSNVGPTAKRGYPCLIPVRQNLSRAANLLKIMSVLASSQSSISMIRKWKQYSVADIQGFQANNSDFQFTDPLSGRQRFGNRYLPGSQLDAPENVEYEFPASKIASAALVEVLQAELRAIASRFNWPEYMVGADASNANYASTQVAEAPGVKQLEREQASYARAFGDGTYSGPAQCGALWRVLSLGVRWGGLPRAILRRVKLQAEGPTLVARDKDKETARYQLLNQAGIMGKKTWSKMEALDRAQEKEDLESEKPAQPPPVPGAVPGAPVPPGTPTGKPPSTSQKRSSTGEPFGGKQGKLPAKESKDASGHEHDPATGQFGKGSGGKAAKEKDRTGGAPKDDPVHGYLDAFTDPDAESPATSEDAVGANADLEGEDSEYRIVPSEGGGWEAMHVDEIESQYGEDWEVRDNPLTGKPVSGDAGYFDDLEGLTGDEVSRSYVQAFNADKGKVTADDLSDANAEMLNDGSAYQLAYDKENGWWHAVPAEEDGEDGDDEEDATEAFRRLLSECSR